MKKILLVAAVASMAMVSCKKDRTCTCTTTSTPSSGAAVTWTEEVTVKKAKKSAAIDGQCRGYTQQTTAPVAGTKTDVTCELK
ncbi:MAG: hypothetical protein K0S32_585 [Bacteroidetes bacterium]|jgi:hypothetical protein|nr:hypothetical protein [Bacteroidota bacterium]